MTTNVPKIYAFKEFNDVADAVADHIIAAQNSVLFDNNILPGQLSSETHSGSRNATLSPPCNSNNTTAQSSAASTPGPSGPVSSSSVSSSTSKFSKKKKKEQMAKRFKIAISGGSLIFVLNKGLLKRNDVFWEKWDIYLADERLVPFDDPQSNYGLAKRNLFDLIESSYAADSSVKKVPKIYHIDELLINDPQECADDYEKLLIKNFANKDSVKLPLFDLFLLGCAPDGHVASLFPDREQLRENFAWVMPVENAPVPPTLRITLTVPVICHSARVTFVVEGSTKAPILKTVFERPDKGLPSSIVNESAAGRVAWFVDDDALDDVLVSKKKYKYEVDTYKNK